MKNKLRAILLVLVLMFSFMLNVNAEIKEDPKEYVGDAFVIGSSRFDASIIVTGTMASKAGAREMIIQYNVYENYDFDPEDIKVYYYSGIDEAWAVLPETSEDEFRFLDEDEAKELEENLNIYYVNEEEKTLEIPFEFEIELEEGFELEYYTHSESHAKRIKYENGKLIMPASTGYLEIVATKGSWEDDDYESIRIVGIKQEEGELEIESASVVSEETLQSLIDGGTGNIQLVESIDLKTALEITKNVSIYIPSDVTLSVKNDTTGNGVFHVLDGGSLNIYGEGTIDAAGKSGTAMAIYAEGGKVILEGNVTYTNNNYTPAEGEELLDQYDLIYAKNDAEIIIGGGIFECKTPLWTLNVEENSDANISVSGGQFYGFNPASYLSEEHKIDAYDSVYWVSQIYESDIAMIGTTAYQFLEQAIAMAPAKSTIKLLRDIELNSMVVVDKELTLDLNGHKIDVIEDFVDYSVFKVIENGKLTITGEGTVDSASQGNDYSMAIWAVNGGEVVIENGTFSNLGAKSVEDDGTTPNNNELIYANGGKITINGGKFIGNTENEKWGTRYTLNLKDNTGSEIAVKGGTFVALNPADVYSEPTQPLSFVANGYKVVKTDGDYTVVPAEETDTVIVNAVNYETLSEAITAATTSSTITLVKDIELEEIVVIDKELTLDLNGHKIDVIEDFVDYSVFKVIENGKLTITGEGTVDSASQGNDYSMAIWAVNGGEVVIENGTFSNLGAKSVEDDGTTPNNNELIYANGGKITINGGKFIGNTENEKWGTRYTLNLKDNTGSEIAVKGGTFVALNPADVYSEPTQPLSFVAEGYKVVKDSEKNEYTVTKYDDNNVTDETELNTLVETAETIKLGSDIKLNSMIIISKELTLDLNGYKIDVIEDFVDYSVFKVIENGKLTITGDGEIDSASQGNDYSMAIWAVNGGEVVIENGTFSNLGAKSVEDNGTTPNNNELIYANGGKITINGGKFIGNSMNETHGAKFTLNMLDNSNSSIVVYGGTFVDYNPADAYSEPTQPKSFLAEGYKTVKNENEYTVVAE